MTTELTQDEKACIRLEAMISAFKSGELTDLSLRGKTSENEINYNDLPDDTVYAHL